MTATTTGWEYTTRDVESGSEGSLGLGGNDLAEMLAAMGCEGWEAWHMRDCTIPSYRRVGLSEGIYSCYTPPTVPGTRVYFKRPARVAGEGR